MAKSISRFARNTVECLSYVRHLQSIGVQLYFEKEGLDTATSVSELILTVMAAFAQEESRSISENLKWGIRKRFEVVSRAGPRPMAIGRPRTVKLSLNRTKLPLCG